MIQFGNKISFAENKSRRTWKPNVQKKTMYSDTLGRTLRFRMTTHAMRCIRKAGCLDEYLVKTRDSELKFPFAIKLKEQIIALRQARGEAASSAKKIKDSITGQQKDDVRDLGAIAQNPTSSALRSTTPAKVSLGLLDLLF